MSVPTVEHKLSFLDLIDICDNVRVHQAPPVPTPFDSELLLPLYLSESPDSPIIGLLRPIIVEQLKLENIRSREIGQEEIWTLMVDETGHSGRKGASVSFRDWLDTPTKRTMAMKELCERWRDTRLFEDVCGPKKWRNELYPVYGDPFGPHDHPNNTADGKQLNFAFEMERSACALFGVVTYGVHLSIYEVDDNRNLKVWIPTRSMSKPTWPGYLDNTVAGGVPSGMPIFESLVKECMEEASIADDIIRKYVRSTGAVSYFFRTSGGWLQPEIEYVYDLLIPPGIDPTIFKPKPLDGEVESFELLSYDAVVDKMRAGLFKANCALVLIDLFIRLGHITPENEPEYIKIVTRLHGQFDYERW